MRGHYTYSVGQKIGELELLRFCQKGLWFARCTCGKSLFVKSNHLYRKRSCGCKSQSNRFKICTSKQVITNQKFNHYKNAAARRKIDFNLSKEEFSTLILGKCYYCGQNPNRVATTTNHSMKWNGIDRLDSSKHYTTDNCVSCCSICNRAKGNLSVDEFMKWIKELKQWSALDV